jgi:LuxR family maltose regulon positive regulatory protein
LILITLGSVYGGIGEAGRARAAAREAREVLKGCGHAGTLPSRLEALERRLRTSAERATPKADRPTEAEIRVLRLLATSRSAREIASELFISVNTVKTHTKSLHHKLGTSSREETVVRAGELGLL